MVFSYSAALASTPAASSSTAAPAPAESTHNIKHLILDAGPLLSLAPLRHLAQTFHTTPAVLAELRDPRARAHWDALKLAGVDVVIEQPSAEAMRRVTEYARESGDYAVLSATDMGVVALTWMWEVRENGEGNLRRAPGEKVVKDEGTAEGASAEGAEDVAGDADAVDVVKEGQAATSVEDDIARLSVADSADGTDMPTDPAPVAPQAESSNASVEAEDANDDDEVDSADDDEVDSENGDASDGVEDDESDGEWITPSNVKSQRSQDLGLLPSGDGEVESVAAACMTGDYAVQNVLLGMGLGLVGEGGKRIVQVRSWVLRCHACFKICRDSSKRFCPSCGNATLLRATVTTSAETGAQTVHLKRNFQYRLRGTKFSIPDPKAGRAKGQQKGGSGLILREDQAEWQEAVRGQQIRRDKEERRAVRGVGGWDDPDWLPEIITVGMNGKGRSGGHGLPSIGHGRKNPNQARRKR
ncbi:20S-pre-rRNA D-site endonuclease nob1 [Cryptotrichosporon argae]